MSRDFHLSPFPIYRLVLLYHVNFDVLKDKLRNRSIVISEIKNLLSKYSKRALFLFPIYHGLQCTTHPQPTLRSHRRKHGMGCLPYFFLTSSLIPLIKPPLRAVIFSLERSSIPNSIIFSFNDRRSSAYHRHHSLIFSVFPSQPHHLPKLCSPITNPSWRRSQSCRLLLFSSFAIQSPILNLTQTPTLAATCGYQTLLQTTCG